MTELDLQLLFAFLAAALPPCGYEDESNCSWLADRGNGIGYELVTVGFPGGDKLSIYGEWHGSPVCERSEWFVEVGR